MPHDKRYSKQEIEEIFEREFGFSTCPHNIYLPTDHCDRCADQAALELDAFLATKRPN